MQTQKSRFSKGIDGICDLIITRDTLCSNSFGLLSASRKWKRKSLNLVLQKPWDKAHLGPSGIRADRDFKFWPCCSVNGRVVAVPDGAEKFLVVHITITASTSPPLGLDLHTSDVHQTPQFDELVAGMLSSWVYADDPEPPHMAQEAFKVHAVTQPGDLGRSVKIASVTAALLLGKVLLIVFKGTSYILDFLSWNLEHDHETTGEADFLLMVAPLARSETPNS